MDKPIVEKWESVLKAEGGGQREKGKGHDLGPRQWRKRPVGKRLDGEG